MHESWRTRSRRGFSMAEILVALAIVAILSAVLLPSLNSHIGKSDASRVATDLTSIQVAAQSFVSDVHRFPSRISQLYTPVTISSQDIDNVNLPSRLVARWKGPYLVKDVLGGTAGGTISDVLTSTAGANGVNFLTVTITGVAQLDFGRIEEILDEGTATSTSATAGAVRFSGGSLTFLALPIL